MLCSSKHVLSLVYNLICGLSAFGDKFVLLIMFKLIVPGLVSANCGNLALHLHLGALLLVYRLLNQMPKTQKASSEEVRLDSS